MIASLRRAAVLVVALLAAGGPAAQPLDSEATRTIAALGLRPGLRVADVGAGNGEWAERIGREVGETGHIYATEVEGDKLQSVQTRLKEAGLKNVTTILGTQEDTGLPPRVLRRDPAAHGLSPFHRSPPDAGQPPQRSTRGGRPVSS